MLQMLILIGREKEASHQLPDRSEDGQLACLEQTHVASQQVAIYTISPSEMNLRNLKSTPQGVLPYSCTDLKTNRSITLIMQK